MVERAPNDDDGAQARAVADRSGSLLVTGAAGSGRSEALVRRFGALISEGVRADRILLLSRTRAGYVVSPTSPKVARRAG